MKIITDIISRVTTRNTFYRYRELSERTEYYPWLKILVRDIA